MADWLSRHTWATCGLGFILGGLFSGLFVIASLARSADVAGSMQDANNTARDVMSFCAQDVPYFRAFQDRANGQVFAVERDNSCGP